METDTITLPAYWSSALVNGDDSSFDMLDDEFAARERAAVAYVLDELADDGWSVVDVARNDEGEPMDPYFSRHYHWHHPDPGAGVTGGDVLEYTIIRTNEGEQR